jgi:hypothetical protein
MLRFLTGVVLALLGLWLMIQLLPVILAFAYGLYLVLTQ